MRMRPITVLATALALWGAGATAARAQDPTATPSASPATSPTPSPSPSASSADTKTDWPKDVQRVYDDYRDDSIIDICSHPQKALQDTLDTIEPDYDRDYPDFREALEAGIERYKAGACKDGSSSSSSSSSGASGASGSSGTTGSTGAAGSSGSSGSSGTESGRLPSAQSGSSGAGAIPPAAAGTSPPAAAVTPAAGAVAPATAAPAAAAAATPALVVTRTGHRSLLIPGILLAIALLGALGLAASALATRRSDSAMSQAWREAAYRTRGTWADFSDWLRLGR
jgi:hypothetical protein